MSGGHPPASSSAAASGGAAAAGAPVLLQAAVVWRRVACAAALLVLLAIAALGAPRLRFDVSNEALFVEGDPTLDQFEELQKTFGSDEVLFLLFDVQDPFRDPERGKLLALGERIAALPFVESLRSPLHSQVIFDEDGELTSRAVAKALPRTPEDVALWRARVLQYLPFRDLLISRDARQVAFLVRLDRAVVTPAKRIEVAKTMRELLAEPEWQGLSCRCVGTPIITEQIAKILGREMAKALGGGLAVALLLLLLLFGTLRAALAPLVLILATLAGTLGLQGLAGVPLSQLSAILITLVICVGIADCMHFVATYQRLARKLAPDEAALESLREVWVPCLLTSATTAAGFLSLLTSNLAPVRNLGLFAALGCLIAYLLLLVVPPAMITGWQPSPLGAGEEGATQQAAGDTHEGDAVGRLLSRVEALVTRRPGLVVGVALVLTLAAAPGMTRLEVDNDLMADLDEDEPLRQDLAFVHERIGGTVAAEVVIEPLVPPVDQLPPAAVLVRAAALEEWIRQAHPAVKAVVGVTEGLLEICKAFGIPQQVPDKDAGTAQLLTLLSSSDSEFYAQHVAVDGSALRISVRMNLIGSKHYKALLGGLQAELERRFQGVARAHITGGAMLLSRSNDYLLETQRDSFLLALIVVSLLVAGSTRELRLGLISLVPNVVPLVIVLGAMGWLGVSISVTIALIATIAIGIVVDDTIHFLHCLREELHAHPEEDTAAAIGATLGSAGRAILFTTLLLVGCFAVYLLGNMGSLRRFGAIACMTFIAAFLCDMLLLPALLRLWPDRPSKAPTQPTQDSAREEPAA
ncbi:MAG: RND family transporter [Planctomycetota bacterium]